MKKTLILLLLTSILFACEKTETKIDNLSFIEVIPGECAIANPIIKQSRDFVPDTVYYTINEDSLTIFVGFTSVCAANHKTGTEISNDTIFIYIDRQNPNLPNCECYFTYDFHYSGIVDPYNYVVNIEGWKFFSGYIKP